MKMNKIIKIFKYSIHGIKFIHMENITFGNNVSVGRMSAIQTWPKDYQINKPELIIHDNVYIGNFCQISCVNRIEIGENTTLGDNVFITDNYHGKNNEVNISPLKRKLYSKGGVSIGKNVLIGRNVCILANVKIGNGAIIGANSVVTHNVDANTVVAGCPAKKIR